MPLEQKWLRTKLDTTGLALYVASACLCNLMQQLPCNLMQHLPCKLTCLRCVAMNGTSKCSTYMSRKTFSTDVLSTAWTALSSRHCCMLSFVLYLVRPLQLPTTALKVMQISPIQHAGMNYHPCIVHDSL